MASASGGFPPLTAFHRSWATCPSCGRLTTSGISGMRPAVVLAWRGSSKSVLFHGENSDLHHQCHTSRIEEISLFTTDTNFCSENVPAVRRSAPQCAAAIYIIYSHPSQPPASCFSHLPHVFVFTTSWRPSPSKAWSKVWDDALVRALGGPMEERNAHGIADRY